MRCQAFLALFMVLLLASIVPVEAYSYNLDYDLNGNVVKDDKFYYEYNELNQLAKIRDKNETGKTVAEYTYDYQGSRTKKINYL